MIVVTDAGPLIYLAGGGMAAPLRARVLSVAGENRIPRSGAASLDGGRTSG